jgi:ABC-type lipoprotein release transport system permease subunit
VRAVLFRLRVEFRPRWRAWTAFAVLAGVVGGAVIAALAGARRTETAYPRFLEATAAFDMLVTNGTTPGNFNRQFDVGEIARLPEVEDVAVVYNYFPSGTGPSGRPITTQDIVALASPDGSFGSRINRARVLEGRLPRGDGEVAASLLARETLGVDIGTTIRLQLTGPNASDVAMREFRVVGTVAIQTGFPPLTGGIPPPLLLSPEYARDHPDAAQVFAIRLRGGTADLPTFARELSRLAGTAGTVTTNRVELTSAVQRGLSVQATALRLLGALMTVVAVLVLGQALARQAAMDVDDHGALRALGFTQAQVTAEAMARAVLVAAVAGWSAVVVAVALSPLTPVGAARHAETNPGLEVNAAYLGGGAFAVFLAVLVLGVVPAWWWSRLSFSGAKRRESDRPGRLTSGLARRGLPAPAVSGVRMAFESGHGRTAVPARSTIVSLALALATVTGVTTFSTSLGRLFDDPQLYGWNWDVQVGDSFSPPLDAEAERLFRHPGATAMAVGSMARVQIGSLLVDTLATEPRRGRIEPTVVEGRPPLGPDEILLGTRTLRELSIRVGDVVTVGLGERETVMEVVGRGVLTEFSGAARLGEGAAMTLEGLRRIDPSVGGNVLLIRLSPGADGAALREELVADRPGNIYLPTKPSDLADLERVGALPSLIAGLMGAMAVATLVHTLLTSVRRRRRDLAVLKVLGFVRREVLATVRWQSSALAIAALVVGMPVGIAAGRWTWYLFADRLGVPPEPATPALFVVLLVPAAILLANVVAAVPARLAAATRPATILHTE